MEESGTQGLQFGWKVPGAPQGPAHLGLAQRAQGLQDLVLQQVLQTGTRLASCCLLPLLIDQDVQHLPQPPGNIRFLDRGVLI